MLKRLDQVATVVMGQSPDGSTYNNEGIGEPLLNGPTEFGSSHPICSLFTTDSKRDCLAGDLIFCVRGSTTGRMNWADRKYSLGRGVCAIRGETHLETKFIKYCIDWRLENLLVLAGGGTFPNLTKDTILGFEIPFPETRFSIASILSVYDDLIENNTRRIAILEEMARRIYEEWFVRFRFPGHEKVRMVESELGLVPEGWEVSTLGAACKRLKSGGTPSRSNDDYWAEGTVDWYKTKELWDGFLFESEEKISEKAIADRKTSVYESGTILMAIYGSPTVGRMGITTRRSTCNQAALGFEPDEQQMTKWFLFHTLYGLRQEFNNKAQGAAQQNISKEKVAETAFIKPPFQVVTAFEQVADPLWSMMRNLQTKNRNLRATRDLLLPKLISGELDVSHLPEPEAMAA